MAVTDIAILKIKEMIISGELGPGDRLPPEKELSEALGLSRSSLRESVKALEVMRVLDVRRGDGTYVTSLRSDLLLDAMSFVVEMHRDDSILEILAVRRILEPAAAGLAAASIDEVGIAELQRSLDSLGPEASVEELVAHDLEFHQLIAGVTGNSYLNSIMQSLGGSTARARVWRGLAEEGAVQRTIEEHRAIAEALRDRDGVLATALMTVHVSGVEHWLRQVR